MGTTITPHPHIRWMNPNDVPDVSKVDGFCDWSSWDADRFMREVDPEDLYGMVATINEAVVGYMIYRLDGDHLELVRMGVDPLYRRSRIGSRLVGFLTRKIEDGRYRSISAMVPEWQLGCQLMLKAIGFNAMKIHRGQCDGFDAYEFRFEVKEAGNGQ